MTDPADRAGGTTPRTRSTRCPPARSAPRRRSCAATRASASAGASPRSSCGSRPRRRSAASRPATRSRARPRRSAGTARTGSAYKALVSLAEDRVVRWEHRPGEQPNMTVDEFHECDEALRRDPRVIAALAARGITDLDSVLFDTWAYGAHLLPEAYDDRRLGWADVWYRAGAGREPVRQPGHRAALHRRPQPHGAAGGGGRAPRRRAAHDGRVRPAARARPRQRDDLQAARDHAARGRVVHARGQRAALAEVVAAGRLQPPRGARAAHRRLRGRRPRRAPSRTGSPSPRWSCPTATRRPTTTAAPRSTSASGASGS